MSEAKQSDAKQFIAECIESGTMTRQGIIDAYHEKYPERKKSTVATYLSDALNRKYTAFDRLARVDKKTGVMSFTKQEIKKK